MRIWEVIVAGLAALGALTWAGWLFTDQDEAKSAAEPATRSAKGIAERDAAGQRCVDQGDVPVMGFGFAVVCIDGAAVVEYTKPDYGEQP